ncbi:MAG: Trk system potassium transporter TrkA [Syntrophomonadaceae bacterium]|nr:Trk system potassium transporter TrkA [Syntrophomonadaceae bacterium]
MKAIIIGAGKVGFSIAQLLSKEDHDVVIIEQSPDRQEILEETLDVQVIGGSGSSTSVLEAAGVRSADMLLAVTEHDELNMVACLLGKKYGIKTTVARVRNPEYLEVRDFDFKEAIGIDLIINPERVTALEIAKIVRHPEAANVDYYAMGKVQMVELEIKKQSPLVGKKIKELDTALPYNIVCIEHQQNILVPRGDDILHEGDRIHLIAQTKEMREVEKMLGFHTPRVEHITILGGGRTGFYLAQILEQSRPELQIKVIEKDLMRARQISAKLKHSLVIQGDGSDYQLLQEENIGNSDLFIAVTDDDKINVLCSLIASNLGVKKAICQVKRTDIMPLVEQIGIDTILSPRMLTAGVILKYLRRGDIISVTVFGDDRAEMLELLAQPGSSAVNKELRHIRFPSGSVIGAVMRDDKVIIPDGNFQIKAHDRLMVFSMLKSIHKIERLFARG